VDDLALVMQVGLDKADDDSVYVTFQIAVPRAVASGGAEGGGQVQVEEALRQALIMLQWRGRSIPGLIDDGKHII